MLPYGKPPSNELHLVAHGAPGQIELGSGIDRAGLLARAAEISNWGVERIYLWSCRVGADQPFVSLLEELSGARVIASTEALGLGNSLKGSGFAELAEAVGALPNELAITGNINFDDFGAYADIYNGYAGLNWSNFYALNGSTNHPGSGYERGATSGSNVAFNGFG